MIARTMQFSSSKKQLLIAGGGIAGMAAATAASHAGWDVRLYERAPTFSEMGAGVQLGPNVVRCLQAWGLQSALRTMAFIPRNMRALDAVSGAALGEIPLGQDMVDRYGAPYVTIHRADLHRLLMEAAFARTNVYINPNQELQEILSVQPSVTIRTSATPCIEGDALLLAGGLWGVLRGVILGEYSRPKYAGLLAYRALVSTKEMPERWRNDDLHMWMGPNTHVVHYPVRRGEQINIIAIVEGPAPQHLQSWGHEANVSALEAAFSQSCTELQDLIRSVVGMGGQWRLWPLCVRPPLQKAEDMGRGNVALIGDVAHPMLPYLAQGAGMSIEDAAELQNVLAMDALDVAERLRRYCINRWQRNSRVQAESARHGEIYHASGMARLYRNANLRMFPRRILDLPWLYGDGVQPGAENTRPSA